MQLRFLIWINNNVQSDLGGIRRAPSDLTMIRPLAQVDKAGLSSSCRRVKRTNHKCRSQIPSSSDLVSTIFAAAFVAGNVENASSNHIRSTDVVVFRTRERAGLHRSKRTMKLNDRVCDAFPLYCPIGRIFPVKWGEFQWVRRSDLRPRKTGGG